MKTTIILPVSRLDFLDAVFHSLEVLDCKREDTNLLAIVDGDAQLFVNVRNRVEMSKFAQRLTIQFKSKHSLRHYDVMGRRLRISDIHNEIKMHIWDCDYIFGLEDDTIITSKTLSTLLRDYSIYPFAGFIQGVQLGRWGVPYVGAWRFDDIYEPTTIQSLMPDKGIKEIDAGGFYCFITKADNYTNHTFKPFENNGLGPDVDYGVELRRLGFLNYIDWSLPTVHRTKKYDITTINTDPKSVVMKKIQGVWRQNHK